jgi:predicted O-linked N-acetylglucosamine transferase (SPINDLY family)
MDYRLTDPFIDPPPVSPVELPAADSLYAEQTIRLPHSFWCYDPIEEAPAVGPSPVERNGFITFGCLNNFCKTNDGVLDLWAKVMKAVPDSRLLLLAPRGRARDRVTREMAAMEVDPPRVHFVEHQPRHEYLATYNKIDIGLDTFPYNGHTTSLDAFWMGVPVITLVGRTAVGRAGLCQLTNLRLTDLVASQVDDFVKIAANLASNSAQLAALRAGLRQRMRQSPLTNAPHFAHGVEEALARMWRKYVALFP